MSSDNTPSHITLSDSDSDVTPPSTPEPTPGPSTEIEVLFRPIPGLPDDLGLDEEETCVCAEDGVEQGLKFVKLIALTLDAHPTCTILNLGRWFDTASNSRSQVFRRSLVSMPRADTVALPFEPGEIDSEARDLVNEAAHDFMIASCRKPSDLSRHAWTVKVWGALARFDCLVKTRGQENLLDLEELFDSVLHYIAEHEPEFYLQSLCAYYYACIGERTCSRALISDVTNSRPLGAFLDTVNSFSSWRTRRIITHDSILAQYPNSSAFVQHALQMLLGIIYVAPELWLNYLIIPTRRQSPCIDLDDLATENAYHGF